MPTRLNSNGQWSRSLVNHGSFNSPCICLRRRRRSSPPRMASRLSPSACVCRRNARLVACNSIRTCSARPCTESNCEWFGTISLAVVHRRRSIAIDLFSITGRSPLSKSGVSKSLTNGSFEVKFCCRFIR